MNFATRQLKQIFLICIVFVTVHFSCAKEQSPEDAQREEERRNLERLQKANGQYEGFALKNDSQQNPQKIPVQLLIQTSKNPNEGIDQPIVQSTLRLGLFGGVELVSSKTSYDWKTHELIAVFSKGKEATENSLELRALIEEGRWKSGKLVGARSGVIDLTMEGHAGHQLKSYKDAKEFSYQLTFNDPKVGGGVAHMTIRREENAAHLDSVTQVESDLPYFPAVRAAFTFQGYEEAPETARMTVYDPLRASLQIFLESGAQIVVSDLFAADIGALSLLEQTPKELRGSVYVGSTLRSSLKLQRVESKAVTNFKRPSRFVGTYQGSPTGLKIKTLVYLDYKGLQKSNSSEQIFKYFPFLQLKILECSLPGRDRLYEAYSLDHIGGVMKFSTTLNEEIVELMPEQNWNGLQGQILNTPIGGGGRVVPKFSVRRVDESLENGCAYFD